MHPKNASAKSHNAGEAGQRRPTTRRTPPAESTSLPAHLKHHLARQGLENAQAQDPSKQKSKQLPQGDTQDSNGSDESASKWFDKANERGPQGQKESPSSNGMSLVCVCCNELFMLITPSQNRPSSLETSTFPITSSHPVATMISSAPSTTLTARTKICVELLTTLPSRIRD